MEKIRVKCAVSGGMFSDEVQATIDTGYGQVETLIPARLVREGELDLVLDHESPEDFFAFIPGEVTKGKHFVRIKKASSRSN